MEGSVTRKEKTTISFFEGRKGSVRQITSLLLTRKSQIEWL